MKIKIKERKNETKQMKEIKYSTVTVLSQNSGHR